MNPADSTDSIVGTELSSDKLATGKGERGHTYVFVVITIKLHICLMNATGERADHSQGVCFITLCDHCSSRWALLLASTLVFLEVVVMAKLLLITGHIHESYCHQLSGGKYSVGKEINTQYLYSIKLYMGSSANDFTETFGHSPYFLSIGKKDHDECSTVTVPVLHICSAVVVRLLLLLAGDVETNPGPCESGMFQSSLYPVCMQ